MTNPTPHGQVPEALIDLIDAYAETRHRYGRIYNAKTEAARKAVIEALSGVQALSAAPAVPAGWKLVPVEPTDEMLKAADDGDDAYTLRSFGPGVQRVMQGPYDHYCAMLAASPTPPAEQQAQPDECFPGEPKVAVPQGLISAACFAIRNKRDGGKVLEQLRRYSVGDRSQPLAPQQAAPKAAPVVWLSSKQLRGVTALHGQYLPFRRQPEGRFDTPVYLEQAAPQPTPAPLSEMPYEKRKAIQEGEQIGASDAWFKARHEMLDTVDRRNVFRAGFDRGWSAAIAAQGGK